MRGSSLPAQRSIVGTMDPGLLASAIPVLLESTRHPGRTGMRDQQPRFGVTGPDVRSPGLDTERGEDVSQPALILAPQ